MQRRQKVTLQEPSDRTAQRRVVGLHPSIPAATIAHVKIKQLGISRLEVIVRRSVPLSSDRLLPYRWLWGSEGDRYNSGIQRRIVPDPVRAAHYGRRLARKKGTRPAGAEPVFQHRKPRHWRGRDWIYSDVGRGLRRARITAARESPHHVMRPAIDATRLKVVSRSHQLNCCD
jgi:hypothetical protein